MEVQVLRAPARPLTVVAQRVGRLPPGSPWRALSIPRIRPLPFWMLCCRTGMVLLPRGHLVMSGDLFDCHDVCVGWGVRLALSGVPFNTLQGTGQAPQQRTVRPQTPAAPGCRGAALGEQQYRCTRESIPTGVQQAFVFFFLLTAKTWK